MRAIDADAMIDRLKEWDTKDKTDKALYNFTLSRINEQPTIQPEPHWIPVEQALPQIGEYVLCETTTRYFGKYHVCKFVDKDKWVDRPHFDWDRHGFPHVIAWMHFKGTKECKRKEVTE